MKAIIVDDEPIAQEILEKFSAKVPFLEVVQCCDTAIEALAVIQDLQPDLIFLDIKMPEMTGVDMLRILRQHQTQVIFTTAYPEYAMDGFELDVTDYLLKPIPFDRFLKAVNKAHDHYKMRSMRESQVGLVSGSGHGDETHIWVKEGKKLVQIRLEDIVLVRALGDYMEVLLPSGKVTVHITMSRLENYLKAPDFLRVNRSCMVRKGAIKSIQDLQIKTILPDEERISIGSTYWDEVKMHVKEWF